MEWILQHGGPIPSGSLIEGSSMKRLATRGLVLLLLTALATVTLGACKKASTATPITPTPVTTTETFSGTIPQLGSAAHSFTVAANGTITISLTSIGPLATCTVITQNDNARANSTAALTGTAVAGNFCAKVYDSGNIPDGTTVAYTIQVVHP
jgi:hypothetical protein